MNLTDCRYVKYKNNGIQVKKENDMLKIRNSTDRHGYLIFTKVFKNKEYKTARIKFTGHTVRGNGASLQIFNFKRNLISEIPVNTSAACFPGCAAFFFAVKTERRSEVVITGIHVTFSAEDVFSKTAVFSHILNSGNDILVVTPSYPTEDNKYFGGFVHSRVKAYQRAGIRFDLVCAHSYPDTCRYHFEGVDVTRTDFMGFRHILTCKKYKTILLHFFDDRYAQILDACDLSETNLFLWVHGPETLYWDWSRMTDPYFVPQSGISNESRLYFERLDRIIGRYNNYPNVTWVFVSEWIKNHSEHLIGIRFHKSVVIPNFIDENNFTYEEKNPELRKKIFMLRRFQNISKYAMDVNIRTILELSRRDFFQELEFHIYGMGEYFDTLVAPVKDFPNVKLHPRFLTHKEIAAVHKKNGIALFATRYDAQGVSMCEAAASGLAVISSQNDAIAEFLPYEEGILCDTENEVLYADLIEKMYQKPEYFQKVSRACHEKVYEKCRFARTIAREIQMIQDTVPYQEICHADNVRDKILSVIVPAYDVACYLFHSVGTMLAHENAGKMEVIIVNDGSRDETLAVAQKLQEKYPDGMVRIIDKENGGHGSAINEGLKAATGRYVRIIDGDDWVDSLEMGRLIGILEKEDNDIVVTNYCEDRAAENILVERKLYEFMQPGRSYPFDDLCHDGYGFSEWGPVLATANFKKEQFHFKLSENSFYVDMEFDAFVAAYARTIVYYPLDIYRYFIGRAGQSVSEESYKRNYAQHEAIIFRLIGFYKNAELSEAKRTYVLNKLILPMIQSHYLILTQYLKSTEKYNAFEKKLSEYPDIYHHTAIVTNMRKMHRKTHGIFVKHEAAIGKLHSLVRR